MKSWQTKAVTAIASCLLLLMIAVVGMNFHSPSPRTTIPAFLAITFAAAALFAFSLVRHQRALGPVHHAADISASSDLHPFIVRTTAPNTVLAGAPANASVVELPVPQPQATQPQLVQPQLPIQIHSQRLRRRHPLARLQRRRPVRQPRRRQPAQFHPVRPGHA